MPKTCTSPLLGIIQNTCGRDEADLGRRSRGQKSRKTLTGRGFCLCTRLVRAYGTNEPDTKVAVGVKLDVYFDSHFHPHHMSPTLSLSFQLTSGQGIGDMCSFCRGKNWKQCK